MPSARSRPSGESCGPSQAAPRPPPCRACGGARAGSGGRCPPRAARSAAATARARPRPSRRVGEQPQPGQRVAHLGALEVGGRAGEPVRAPRAPRAPSRPRALALDRPHEHADLPGGTPLGHQPLRLPRHCLRLRALGAAAPERTLPPRRPVSRLPIRSSIGSTTAPAAVRMRRPERWLRSSRTIRAPGARARSRPGSWSTPRGSGRSPGRRRRPRSRCRAPARGAGAAPPARSSCPGTRPRARGGRLREPRPDVRAARAAAWTPAGSGRRSRARLTQTGPVVTRVDLGELELAVGARARGVARPASSPAESPRRSGGTPRRTPSRPSAGRSGRRSSPRAARGCRGSRGGGAAGRRSARAAAPRRSAGVTGLERRVEPDLERLVAQQSRREAVEGGHPQLLVGPSISLSSRARISAAAGVEKVSASIESGGVPCSTSQRKRRTSVRVFPVPAPATTSSGPPGWVTAASCASFRPSLARDIRA